MDKKLIVILAVVVALIILAGAVAAVWVVMSFVWIPSHRSSHLPPPTFSAEAPADTAVVFNFQAHGDKDAVLYAIAFPRALSDRLVCAPKSLVQQPSSQDLLDHMRSAGAGPGKSIPDAHASKVATCMGVRYALVGDFDLKGDQVMVTVRVLDTSAKSGRPIGTISKSGKLADLRMMQLSLAEWFLKAIKLTRPADLSKPNFSTPKTLALYGRSCLAETAVQSENLRWQAWESDRESLFPALRLLEFYTFGPASCGDILRKTRLSEVISSAKAHNAGNTFLDLTSGLLLVRQCRYRDAQVVAEGAVRSDPGMARAHDLLAYVALLRGDAELAIREGEQELSIWPSRPYSHLRVADGHKLAASNARRGQYFGSMSRSARNAWDKQSQKALQEAQIAVAIDPDCGPAWSSILTLARELGDDTLMDTAAGETLRINPKNVQAYHEYAFTFSPQWGGSPGQQESVFGQAEQVFGVDSAEMCLLRSMVLFDNTGSQDRSEILRLLDKATSKSKDAYVTDRAAHLKCSVLLGLKRKDEMFQLARKMFDRNPNLEWRMQLAKAYQYRWQDAGDRPALDKAAEMLRVYVDEMPFDPKGHVQYGWCLSHQGKPDLARRQFETALELDPQNEQAMDKLKYVEQ